MTKAQKRMKKARTGAWSPEARAKREAKWAARRRLKKAMAKALPGAGRSVAEVRADTFKDVTVYLEKAERLLLSQPRKRLSGPETLMMLALNTLRGEI